MGRTMSDLMNAPAILDKLSVIESILLKVESEDLQSEYVDPMDTSISNEGNLVVISRESMSPVMVNVLEKAGRLVQDAKRILNISSSVSVKLETSLPHNEYKNNCYRNSIFFDEQPATL